MIPGRVLTLVFALAALPATAPAQGAEAGVSLAAIGGGVISVSAVVDIVRAGESARLYNAERLGIRPVVDPARRTVELTIFYSLHPARDPTTRTGVAQARSPSSATAWSTVTTLAPVLAGGAIMAAGGWNDNHTTLATGGTLAFSGLLIGPATGHWYAGRPSRSIAGIAIRFGATLLGVVGATLIANAPED